MRFVSASIMQTIQTGLGQAWASFLPMCALDAYCKLKRIQDLGVARLGVLISIEATLKEQLLMEN